MKPYLDVMKQILDQGDWQENRTGVKTLMIPGAFMQFDLQRGFPAVTTKKLAWKSVVGELCGFLKGVQSAKDFRDLGTKIWDQNANENKQWLANPFREGTDDLGRIYGVQWRRWVGYKYLTGSVSAAMRKHLTDNGWDVVLDNGDTSTSDKNTEEVWWKGIDQLGICIRKILETPQDRRIIFHAWNPAELDEMALPPCHLLYQFVVNQAKKELNLSMTMR